MLCYYNCDLQKVTGEITTNYTHLLKTVASSFETFLDNGYASNDTSPLLKLFLQLIKVHVRCMSKHAVEKLKEVGLLVEKGVSTYPNISK